MRTTILKVIGATLIASFTVQMTAAAEHHARRARAPAIEQFRNSNAYAAPESFPAWSPSGSEQVESAMTSGIAGH
jgi:hypothetical protein